MHNLSCWYALNEQNEQPSNSADQLKLWWELHARSKIGAAWSALFMSLVPEFENTLPFSMCDYCLKEQFDTSII